MDKVRYKLYFPGVFNFSMFLLSMSFNGIGVRLDVPAVAYKVLIDKVRMNECGTFILMHGVNTVKYACITYGIS